MPVSELTILKIENMTYQIRLCEIQREAFVREAQLEAGVSERATWNVQTRQFSEAAPSEVDGA